MIIKEAKEEIEKLMFVLFYELIHTKAKNTFITIGHYRFIFKDSNIDNDILLDFKKSLYKCIFLEYKLYSEENFKTIKKILFKINILLKEDTKK
jgi:hypothetical protein